MKPFFQPVTDIIRRRFSCRSYARQPIEPPALEALQTAVDALPLPPFGTTGRFQLITATAQDALALKGLSAYGNIKNPAGFIIGIAGKSGAGTLEDFGFCMEYLVLKATDLGLGSCWIGGIFSRSSFGKKTDLQESEEIPSIVAIGNMADEKAARTGLVRRLSKGTQRLARAELFFDGNFATPLAPEVASPFTEALEMVRLAPSASNKQPWRVVRENDQWHFFLRRTKGYPPPIVRSLLKLSDLQRVDMGIAMCHFELALKEAGMTGKWVIKTPEIQKIDSPPEYTATWKPLM